MTCARCGMSVRLRDASLSLDRCPRCFAYAGISVPLRGNRRRSLEPGQDAPRPTLPRASLPQANRPSGRTSFGHLVVATEQVGEVTLIALKGKLDLASEDCLDQALRRAWVTQSAELVIDLTDLEFIDATGIKVLLRAREYMLEHGGRMFLIPGPPSVQRMFQLSGTLALFSFRT